MSRCKQCNVEILEPTARCPLCNHVLEKTEDLEAMYPDIYQKTRTFTMILRIYSFVAIMVEVILITLLLVGKINTMECIIPGIALFYVYMVFRFAVVGKSGHRAKIMVLSLLGVLTMVALDYTIGFDGWSINYAFPAAIMVVDTGLIVLIFVNKRNWQSYLMPQLFMVLAGLLGLMLYKFEIITSSTMIIIAFDFSVLLFIGTVIIGGRRARTELKRRFHIS